jgi:DNA-binding NarL/FixJ family response regulator
MSPYRIVLADDHALLRQGLKKIIDGQDDFAIVGDVGDGITLLRLLKKVICDMVILDISMPNLRGIEATCEIKKLNPRVKVLVLTMHKDVELVHQSFVAGADGYLLKDSADTELLSAIRKIRSGKIHVSSQLMDTLAHDWVQTSKGIRKSAKDKLTLSAREREVLKLLAEGKTSKEIAELLVISTRTVEHHRANIQFRLNLKNTADLIRYAVQKGYI